MTGPIIDSKVAWPRKMVDTIGMHSAATVADVNIDTIAEHIHTDVSDSSLAHDPNGNPQTVRGQQQAAVSANADPHWSFHRDGFALQPRGRPFVLEVFAGSARLTKHLRAAGLDAWAVDWKGSRLQPETASIVHLNLTAPADRHALFRLLEHPELMYVHFEPPCGTANRARDIPLGPGSACGPPPLRSEAFPSGLPDLHPKQAARVSAANLLYNLTAACADILVAKNVMWSIGNPRGSYMWLMPCMLDLCSRDDVHMATFQSCAWGGQRPKWTAWLHYPGLAFEELSTVCPGISGTHTHKPWGRDANCTFASALETVYPEILCQKITDLLLKFFDRQPERPLPVIRSRGAQLLRRHRPQRAAAARQARGGAGRQLLPEFERVICIRGHFPPSDTRCRPGHVWPACEVNGITVPVASKTVRVSFGGVAGTSSSASALLESCLPSRGCIRCITVLADNDIYIGREYCNKQGRHLSESKWANPFKVHAGRSTEEAVAQYDSMLRASPVLISCLPELLGKRLCCHCSPGRPCHADALIAAAGDYVLEAPTLETTIHVGIFRQPEEFARAALQLPHPFEEHASTDAVIEGLRFRMAHGMDEVAWVRREALQKWTARAKELEVQEQHLHDTMDPGVARVMQGKRILLLKEMMVDVGFPSAAALAHHLATGFPLAGEYPVTEVFPESRRDALFAVQDLWRDRKSIRQEVLAACRPSGDDDLDAMLYEATVAEVERGWLEGPLEAADVDQLGLWVPSRRFGIMQTGKLRAIDDFTVSRVNSALSSREKIDPADIDHIAANARIHCDALVASAECRHTSSPFIDLQRHSDYQGAMLMGRLYDIKSAYKQIAVHPSQKELSVIACWCPSSQSPRLFRLVSQPFGASAAVLSFNWLAAAICRIFVVAFRLGVTNFYDDFTIFEVDRLVESAEQTFTSVMALLGWPLKETKGFDVKPEPLGAVIDLSMAAEGVIKVGNRAERAAEVMRGINDFVDKGRVDQHELQKLRGRILFARSLCYGRFAACALRALNRWCTSAAASSLRRAAQPIENDLKEALMRLGHAIVGSPARLLKVTYLSPAVAFTDAAFEPGEQLCISLGGLLFDPVSHRCFYFAVEMFGAIAEQLATLTANPIAVLELLAVCVGLAIWGPLLADLASIVFVDNEAAKHALVKGSSSEKLMASVTEAACDLEIAARTTGYYERVPSSSNPADNPSRGRALPHVKGWPLPRRLVFDEWVSCITGLSGAASFWSNAGGLMRPTLDRCSMHCPVLSRVFVPAASCPDKALAECSAAEVAGQFVRGLRDLDLRDVDERLPAKEL